MVKYLLFQGYGNRVHLRDRIRNKIRNLGLGMDVESLKFEGGREKQFYFGVGVNIENSERENSDIIQRLINAIDGHPVRNGASLFFDEEDVSKGFLSDNFEYDSFLEPIRFEPGVDSREDFFSGLDLPDQDGHLTVNDVLNMDRLLWWMSAKGEGAWQAFRESISLLWSGYPMEQFSFWSLMRKLMLLGYVEVDDDWRWGMTPTMFVHSTYAGIFLVGKVTPVVMRGLGDYKESSSNGGPTRIGLDGFSAQSDIPVLDDPALAISTVLPVVEMWKAGLRGEPDIEPHRYRLKLYDGRCFNEYLESTVRPGFYEVERLEGNAISKRVLFDGQRWVGGGYYDLLWLAKKIGGSAMEVWLGGKGTILIPVAERWPMLYERPLVLASGRLPVMQDIGGHKVLLYEAVGKDIAGILAGKLGVKLKDA